MIPERLKSNINLDASPTDPKHIVNKEYVDGNHVEISWADYQSLPEEEKMNGTTYFVPDMPVSPSGEVIGEVERLNGALGSNVTGLDVGSIIPFVTSSNSNMTITDGLVTLKKGKTYRIFCDLRFGYSSGSDGFAFYGIKDSNGKKYGVNGYDESDTRTTGGFGSHTSVDYVLTPDENITLCVFIDNGENVTTLYASSAKLTILEIPNYQGLIDVSDEHIKEIAQSYLSEKDYLKLATLSNGGYARISSWVDSNNGRTQMSFDINTSDGKTERIQFDNIDGQLSVYENDGNDNWTYKGRYIKTKVDDIPVTQISLDETKFIKLASSSGIKYCVVNGICTIQTDGVGLINTGNITVCSGLPRPLLGIARGILQVEANTDNPTKPVYIQVVGDKLSLYSTSSTGHFWGDLSYPVAES